MQPDAWKGRKGIEEEEKKEKKKNWVWDYGGVNYLLDICWGKKQGQMGIDLKKSL